MMKKLPIGIEFFENFKRDDFYYLDKTGLIRDLIITRGSVNLFTRPPPQIREKPESGYVEDFF